MAILYNDEGKPITKANPLPVSFEDANINLPPGSVVFPDEIKTQLEDDTGAPVGTTTNPLVTQLSGSTFPDGESLPVQSRIKRLQESASVEIAPGGTHVVTLTAVTTTLMAFAMSCSTDQYIRVKISGTGSRNWNPLPRDGGSGSLPVHWFPQQLRPYEGRHPDWVLYDDEPSNYGMALARPQTFAGGVNVEIQNTAGSTAFYVAYSLYGYTEE